VAKCRCGLQLLFGGTFAVQPLSSTLLWVHLLQHVGAAELVAPCGWPCQATSCACA
jgi:hypothetical protein